MCEYLVVHSEVMWDKEQFLVETVQNSGSHPLGVRNVPPRTVVTTQPPNSPRGPSHVC